jgi:hypothetical protein
MLWRWATAEHPRFVVLRRPFKRRREDIGDMTDLTWQENPEQP